MASDHSEAMEFKEWMLQDLIRGRHIHSPSETLKLANSVGCVAELLEAQGCAYLAPFVDLSDEIDRLIEIDDKDQFASFLVKNHDKIKEFPPADVFESICLKNAVGCATAFLDSRLAADVCINAIFNNVAMAPLHVAVAQKCRGLIDLLLSHGALVDVRSCFGTPITLALESLRCPYVTDWIAREQPVSYFKLIDLLGSPELEQRIDTIRTLISRTEQLRGLCLRCIEYGQSFRLAVVLFVSRDKLLVPSSNQGGLEDTPIMQYIREELAQKSENKKYKNESMIDALNAIENFWRFERMQKHEVSCDIASDLARNVELDWEPSVVSSDISDSPPLKLTSKGEVPSRKICSAEQTSYGAKYMSRLNRSRTNRAFQTWQPAVHFNIFKPVENQLLKTVQVKSSLRNVLASPRVHASLLGVARRCIK